MAYADKRNTGFCSGIYIYMENNDIGVGFVMYYGSAYQCTHRKTGS